MLLKAEQPIGVMTVSSSETELGFPLQTNDDKNNNNQNVRVDESVEKNKKKKKKSVNILKVALMLLRRRSRKSNNNPALDVASKGMWNRLVGAMRPLHLQSDHAPPTLQVVPSLPATTEPAPPLLHSSPSVDSFEDVSSSSSSVDSMSRYFIFFFTDYLVLVFQTVENNYITTFYFLFMIDRDRFKCTSVT